jgi:hypothetical protein
MGATTYGTWLAIACIPALLLIGGGTEYTAGTDTDSVLAEASIWHFIQGAGRHAATYRLSFIKLIIWFKPSIHVGLHASNSCSTFLP